MAAGSERGVDAFVGRTGPRKNPNAVILPPGDPGGCLRADELGDMDRVLLFQSTLGLFLRVPRSADSRPDDPAIWVDGGP